MWTVRNKGSRSFTCHPHTNHTCLYSPAARHHRHLAGTNLLNLYCLVNRGTWETCPAFLRRVPGRDSNPRPLDRKSDTLPTTPQRHLTKYRLGWFSACFVCVQTGRRHYKWLAPDMIVAVVDLSYRIFGCALSLNGFDGMTPGIFLRVCAASYVRWRQCVFC